MGGAVAKRGKGPEIRTVQPLRTAAQRLLFLIFLGTAIALMVIGRTDPTAFDRARTQVVDAAAPVLDTLSRPVAAFDALVTEFRHLMHLREENAQLRQDIANLRDWQAVARRLEVENAQMRALLAFEREDVQRVVTGRVIGMGGTFVRSVLLNIGTEDGVRKGQTAVTGDGFIGRVAAAGRRSARVLLITDLNSRVPVLVENSRARAILAGDNTAFPRLIYGEANSDMRVGQRVVTSGDAGAFPQGLPVGIIVSADESGVRVQPYATEARPELVRLMDFGLDGILADGAPASR